jgi:hypothetical protein
MRDPAEAQQAALSYRQALESAVRVEELVAAHFTMLADEVAQQAHPRSQICSATQASSIELAA